MNNVQATETPTPVPTDDGGDDDDFADAPPTTGTPDPLTAVQELPQTGETPRTRSGAVAALLGLLLLGSIGVMWRKRDA